MNPGSRALGLVSALALSPAFTGQTAAQSTPSSARPVPARLPLTITAVRCEYGGSVPGIFVYFDASATAPVTGLHASSLMIGSRALGWGIGNDGALSARAWSGVPGTASATPRVFNGAMTPGTTLHLQVFARLTMSIFGSGVTYPNRELGFQLVLGAAEGVLEIDGPRCSITPAG